jgi:hypothetical protein
MFVSGYIRQGVKTSLGSAVAAAGFVEQAGEQISFSGSSSH